MLAFPLQTVPVWDSSNCPNFQLWDSFRRQLAGLRESEATLQFFGSYLCGRAQVQQFEGRARCRARSLLGDHAQRHQVRSRAAHSAFRHS